MDNFNQLVNCNQLDNYNQLKLNLKMDNTIAKQNQFPSFFGRPMHGMTLFQQFYPYLFNFTNPSLNRKFLSLNLII